MKKLAPVFKGLLFLLLPGIFLTSCSKDDPGINESFNWSLNDKAYTAGTGAHAARVPGSSQVVINGFTNAVSQLQITIENCDKAGTYIAKGLSMVPDSVFLHLQVGDDIYNTVNNSVTETVVITITKLTSNSIQGNFNGTVHAVVASGAGPAYSLKGEFNLKLW